MQLLSTKRGILSGGRFTRRHWLSVVVIAAMLDYCRLRRFEEPAFGLAEVEARHAAGGRLAQKDEKGAYYHVGLAGGKLPKGLMRLVIVEHANNGEVHWPDETLIFRHDGDNCYMNVVCTMANRRPLPAAEKKWKPEAVESYDIVKYKIEENTLVVWGDRQRRQATCYGAAIKK